MFSLNFWPNMISLMILFMSSSLLMSNHPLTMGTTIIFQAMMVSIFMSITFFSSWFSFLIFIVYLGGVLMLFSYIISMMQMKEKMIKKTKILNILYITSIILIISFNLDFYYSEMTMNFKNLDYEKLIILPFSYHFKTNITMLIFLLFVMVVVVLLIEKSKGSMRSF